MVEPAALPLVEQVVGIRWGFAGVIDRLEDESVATMFFHTIVPVWPGKTYYRTPHGSFAIPTDRRSVVLGFTRRIAWLAAILLASPAVFDPGHWLALLPIAALVAGLAALATWGAGRLDPAERSRRELLKRATGLGAPPELLPPALLVQRRENLADEWFEAHQINWQSAIKARIADEMLVALAEYHGDARLVQRARNNMFDALGN